MRWQDLGLMKGTRVYGLEGSIAGSGQDSANIVRIEGSSSGEQNPPAGRSLSNIISTSHSEKNHTAFLTFFSPLGVGARPIRLLQLLPPVSDLRGCSTSCIYRCHNFGRTPARYICSVHGLPHNPANKAMSKLCILCWLSSQPSPLGSARTNVFK